MLSVQGLIIMFMFGVATTLTITAMWLFYTEYKLNQQKQRERISQDLLRQIFGKDKECRIEQTEEEQSLRREVVAKKHTPI